ncbi:hypothetical protein DsansV1_C18g0151601 [Dioscorea sansibarensis]
MGFAVEFREDKPMIAGTQVVTICRPLAHLNQGHESIPSASVAVVGVASISVAAAVVTASAATATTAAAAAATTATTTA